MANTPKKIKDPTEAALSAIQEALNVRDQESPTSATVMSMPADRIGTDRPLDPQFANQTNQGALFDDELLPEQPGALRRPANDDRESVGQILRALQRRPGSMSYTMASAFALAWAVVGLGLGWLFRNDLQLVFSTPDNSTTVLIALGAIVLAPIVFFYMLAHMAWRAQELRLITESMATLAMRLSEPETAARDSIVNVGQAVRREVAAMGDGVERALARAAELEALVSNEVSALERAFNDNELRIRGLLQGLATQRETLVGQADQMRAAIEGVQVNLGHDIASISDLVNERIHESANRIAMTLAEKGEHITRALGSAGDGMIEALGERGGDLIGRLEAVGDNTSRAISQASEQLSTSLNFKTDHINAEFESLADHLQRTMSSRLDHIVDNFADRSTTVVDMMSSRSQELTETIVDTGTRLSEVIANRIEEANNTLRSTGDSLVLDLSLRGGEVVANLEATGARITDTIVSRSDRVAETFRDSAQQIADVIGNRGDNIRELLQTRLQSFEEMFAHGGVELAERIGRDSNSLGNLITRHLGEFDRTVKTYGGELVDRLSERTQDVADAIRNYVDNFDSRVGVRTAEVTNNLDQRLVQFQEMLDGRTESLSDALTGRVGEIDQRIQRFQETLDHRTENLNEALGGRVLDIARTLAEGGKEVVTALDKRIADVTMAINVRGAKLADTIGSKIVEIDRALGARAVEVANNLDTRLGRFDEILIGRAESVAEQIETRSKTAADLLTGRMEQLSASIMTNAGQAEKALGSLTVNTTQAILTSTQDAERRMTAVSTGVSVTLKQNATDVERTLLAVSAEAARTFVGKAEEISNTIQERAADMTRVLDESSSGLLSALTGKSQEFASEVGRVTDHAVKAIEAKGFAFTQSMMDNSEDIARLINVASETATGSVKTTLKDLQSTTEESTKAATATLIGTMRELQNASRNAVEESKQTAAGAVREMMETHGMLRSDTTAMFERLREANILLQEVLSGAHENMSSIESTLVKRVSEFVTSMNDVAEKTGMANGQVVEHMDAFQGLTSTVLSDLSQLAVQFEMHGRSLAEAVSLVDSSNRRTEDMLAERRVSLDSLVATIDIRTEDLEQRLTRLQTLLDQSLEGATGRAREVAEVVVTATSEGTRALNVQLQSMRTATEEERDRTAATLRSLYETATQDGQALVSQSVARFTEIVDGLRKMTGDMQHELNATRNELRRGILELPQETAESASQMRRVIVDQIEALAELNRIVARHGRGLDSVEPGRTRALPQTQPAEPAYAQAQAYAQPQQRAETRPEPPRMPRGDLPAPPLPPSPMPTRRAEAPSLAPANQGTGRDNRSGWLTDLLSRASREEPAPQPQQRASAPPPPPPAPPEIPREVFREPPQSEDRPARGEDRPARGEERPARHSIESLDSLAVDIARMIDHDVAAELWDRYKRGERNVFTRRLYTMQGQKAFDEIRKKYRGDREFTQTVDRYIAEFERLLEEVARDDRGQVVVRTYLTSETGKVYTMLAHAAGRFD